MKKRLALSTILFFSVWRFLDFCSKMGNENNITMGKRFAMPFSITAEKKGKHAEIRIIGVIGWETSSEDFRRQVDSILAEGITDAHIYINSVGGSCFDASEIVNIISKFKGNVTGEGGAIVASAGTYIALHCKDFSMPANGQFMVHKPHCFAEGTADELAATIKGLKDTEALYYEAYKSVASDISELDRRWGTGDWWMTAGEAKKMGFITAVRPRVKIDKDTAEQARACGCPVAFVPEKSTETKNDKKMEFIALALGLKSDATQADITAKLTELQNRAARVDELEKTIKGVREAQVTAMVDAAAGKKITADKRQHFIDLGNNAGVDVLKNTLDAIPEIVKPTDVIVPGKTVDGKLIEKKFEDLTEAELKDLRENNRAEYVRLFRAHYNVEPVIN
ncbi:MAG: ATP-dependent Clp protease proteolytic subunit [Spirochaetales bacterium]|jgi:ATP-dependent protease ClpP protease subunit|nr:ATP-dependent Clp protease proteolytic subunit [Spirochaetales bacterium]